MSTASAHTGFVLGPQHNGMRMTPAEFDSVTEYDEHYRYELINGVVVVASLPLAFETDPNEELGRWLRNYQEAHPSGHAIDVSLPQQYIRTRSSRRIADRVIWLGLGRMPDRRRDVPGIAIEFVSAGRRSWKRDYVEKKREYLAIGVQEYWIIGRFQRTMTVYRNEPDGPRETVIPENRIYRTPLLPGFKLPLRRLLAIADRWTGAEGEEDE